MEFPAKICKQHSHHQFQKVCKSLTAYVIALFFAEKRGTRFVRHLYLDDICLRRPTQWCSLCLQCS